MPSAQTRQGTSTKLKDQLVSGLVGLVLGVLATVLGGWLFNYVQQVTEVGYPGQPYHYVAARPGCADKVDGWQVGQGSLNCLTDRMELHVEPPKGATQATAQAVFVDQRPFPSNYRVTVTVSDITAGSCAGVLIRGNQAQASGYAFFLCPGPAGQWQIIRFEPNNPTPRRLEGKLPATTGSTYTITVTAQDTRYELFINRDSMQTVDDKLFVNTENINLMASPAGSAGFADFALDEI